jgi:hypothetical protein
VGHVRSAPAESQRRHWKANDRTPPTHVPALADNSSPTCGVPVIVGGAVFLGAALPVTTSVGAEFAEVCPSAFDALTMTRKVRSTSLDVTL